MFFVVLDHTADVQLHAYSPTLEGVLIDTIMAMYNYMTITDAIQDPPSESFVVEFDPRTQSDEKQNYYCVSLLIYLMEECLFRFHCEPFIVAKNIVIDLKRGTCKVCGPCFDPRRHPTKTEVKAVTRSNARVTFVPEERLWHSYIVVDI